MALRQISDKMLSGELTGINLGGVTPDDKVVVTGDLLTFVPEAPIDGLFYGRRSASWKDLEEEFVKWYGIWVAGTYKKNSMVRDNDWTMIANKETTDEPSPQAVGDKSYVLEELPSWSIDNWTGGVWTGIRVRNLVDAYLITKIASWLPDVSEYARYQVIVVNNLTGVRQVGPVFKGSVLAEVGWYEVAIKPLWITPGADITVYLITQNYSATVVNDYPWNWLPPDNAENNPGAGNMEVNKGFTVFRVSTLDADIIDRSGVLDTAMKIGTTFKAVDQSDVDKFSELEVIGWTDHGTYITYDIVNRQSGPNGVPGNGAICDVYISVPTELPATYVYETDKFLGSGYLSGELILSSGAPVNSPDAYGVDIEIQKYVVSPDWDLIAYSEGAGTAAGASFTYDFVKLALHVVPSNVYTEVLRLVTPTRPAGVYEYKISLTYHLDSITTSAYFQFSTDNGATWFEFVAEPKDQTDARPLTYFFPKEHIAGSKSIILEARKENNGDVMTIDYVDLIIQKVR